MAERLVELEARKAEARVAGGAKAIERHHAKGSMTARERIEYLLDEDSFQELDMLNRHVASGMGLEDTRPYTDGVITGYGKVDGRLVAVAAYDFTVMASSMGMTGELKVTRLRERLGNPERCVAEEPVLREMASRHQVACHFAEDVDGTAEQVQITGRSGRGASGKTDA